MTNKRRYNLFDRLYETGWQLSMPLLRRSSRLKDGFCDRQNPDNLPAVDIWIQAASAGEAYLACSLLAGLKPARPVRILITSNTRQGIDIIDYFIRNKIPETAGITAFFAFFPFDRPAIMDAAVRRVGPRVMVLLETEIWPGLISALKRNHTRILIINGRLSKHSLRGYLLLKSLWSRRGPDLVMAVSPDDARRFSRIFGPDKVRLMRNIKFDRLPFTGHAADNPLRQLIPTTASFLVLGSIRQEEETHVGKIIREIHGLLPQTVTGIFPRHMHRINHWTKTLDLMDIPWMRRSALNGRAPRAGTLVLWDAFGELNQAYDLAKAVFVGGSLAPLGGQNFLEPLAYGVRPVIGPYWDHFAWVGEDILRQGLVIKAENWRHAAAELVRRLRRPEPKEPVREAAMHYIRDRMGGTQQACVAILSALKAATTGSAIPGKPQKRF